MHRFRLSASLGLALALAGCAGNAMSPAPAVPAAPAAPAVATGGHSSAADAASAVHASGVADCPECTASFEAVDGIGGAVGALGVQNAALRPPKNPMYGMCMNGTEVFSPDTAGDPNSSEVKIFYDNSCQHLARDTVRRFNQGSKCDTVKVTVTNYSAIDGSKVSTRMATVQIFGSVREAQSRFSIGERTIDSSIELIVPSSSNVSKFCGDWAGYNATGVAHMGTDTFGWSGMFANGKRTVNSDGSVTWSGRRMTTFYEGHLGHLKIDQGSYNTSCPISTPAYTIGGGTKIGSSMGQTLATFNNGVLTALFVSRTAISGRYYVFAQSNKGVSPNSPDFITGTVIHKGKTVSTFSINYIGNGTLYLESTGCRYDVAGWTVVRR